MRVKLGPYKITRELWFRMQQLPGDNDEQRTLMAIDFAIEAYNDPRLADARAKAEQAENERKGLFGITKVDSERGTIAVGTLDGIPSGEHP